jgi:hypothetical protein
MATIPKKVRVAANPKRSNRPAHSSRPTNAAPRKGNKMANHKKAANAKKSNRHKKNAAANNPHRRKNRRRNPDMFGASTGDLVITSVAGLANAVLTKQLPQLVFASGNTGVEGYAMNLVTALAGAWAAGKFAGPKAGMGAMVGGMVILLDRILTEQFSSIGSYLSLSGVGDATAVTKMGTVRDGYYLHPTMVDGNSNMIVPDPVTQAAMSAVLAKYPQLAAPMAAVTTSAGAGGAMHAVNPSALRKHVSSGQLLSSRFQGRFNQSLN